MHSGVKRLASKKGTNWFENCHAKNRLNVIYTIGLFSCLMLINKTVLGKNDLTQNQSGVASDTAPQGGARSSLRIVR